MQVVKNFKYCNHVINQTKEDKLILEIIPHPELHLMLGVVNTLFDSMLKQCDLGALKRTKLCHIKCKVTYGSPTFRGNSCTVLLSTVDILRSNSGIGCFKFVTAFQKYNDVEECSTVNLNSEYTKSISDYRQLHRWCWYSSYVESTYGFLSF